MKLQFSQKKNEATIVLSNPLLELIHHLLFKSTLNGAHGHLIHVM
jgi:hypothetical protein